MTTQMSMHTLSMMGVSIEDEINKLQQRRKELVELRPKLRKLINKAAQRGIEITKWGEVVHLINVTIDSIPINLTLERVR